MRDDDATDGADPAVAPTASLPGAPLEVSQVAAPYQDAREIGRGGMGRVMRARDPRLGREVAIKLLTAPGAAARARFAREARITARLQHPGIVPVYEAGLDGGVPFYAMRRVVGRTLADAIRAAKDLPARLALLRHVGAVADAVAYAHSEQIVHRDLKASNVVIGGFGETVVIDWGLAKVVGDDDDVPDAGPFRRGDAGGESGDGLTEAGTVLGTPAYMPPEQAEGLPVDARADVYAIGVMLYHLVAGEMPYQGRSSEAILLAILDGAAAADRAAGRRRAARSGRDHRQGDGARAGRSLSERARARQ